MVRPLLPRFALVASVAVPIQASAQDIPTDEVGDTGSITFDLQGTPTTNALVRAADGHVWTQQDLGSSNVGSSATDASAYGRLYQWGRWNDGHALRTSTTAPVTGLSANDPTGLGAGSALFITGNNPTDWWGGGSDADSWSGSTATATNGIDPCSALGAGWQLPERDDWVALLEAEGITNSATAFGSNLKLVLGGSREGVMGNLINVGSFANYWSSTPNTAYAKNLTIGGDLVNPQDDALRSYGMSVRCLHKSLHVGVEGVEAADQLRIFPVPSSGPFTVEAGSAIRSVRVFTADGRLLQVMAPRSLRATLELPMGLYHLELDLERALVRRSVVILP
ncbi:MAG TPA: hypothetical protein VGE21_00645 [Flavobacteriales bacterium]